MAWDDLWIEEWHINDFKGIFVGIFVTSIESTEKWHINFEKFIS